MACSDKTRQAIKVHMDDVVRHVLSDIASLGARFENDITVKSIILANGQEPLVAQPATLRAYEPMSMEFVNASRALARALVDSVQEDLRGRPCA